MGANGPSKDSPHGTCEASVAPPAAIPAIIVEAGGQAGDHYLAYFGTLKTSTARNYAVGARRFCEWAADQALALRAIRPADVERFEHALRQDVAASTAGFYLAGLRSLFSYLTTKNVIPASPFVWQPLPLPAAGFDVLALLAMLANMEPEALRRIFDEEPIAIALLREIRWPLKPVCPSCGSEEIVIATADTDPAHDCLGCRRRVDILDDTMFAGSAAPLRPWLRLIHHQVLAGESFSDAQLAEQLDIDAASVSALRSRIQAVLEGERVPSGEQLQDVLKAKDRDLINYQFARGVIRYADMTSLRERLREAKAQGKDIPELPEGLSVDDALSRLDQQIAEADLWVHYVKDGYIVSERADNVLPGAPSPGPSDC
jgi:hypothetical protein